MILTKNSSDYMPKSNMSPNRDISALAPWFQPYVLSFWEKANLTLKGYTKVASPKDLSSLTEKDILRLKNGEIWKKPIASPKEIWEVFITEGFRNSERQNWLYASGRTRIGRIVTYVKAGESDHNYGRAIDICFRNVRTRAISYDVELFKKVIPIAKKIGFSCGADWSGSKILKMTDKTVTVKKGGEFQDYPHFYMKAPKK